LGFFIFATDKKDDFSALAATLKWTRDLGSTAVATGVNSTRLLRFYNVVKKIDAGLNFIKNY